MSAVVPLQRGAGRSYLEVVIGYRGGTGRPQYETGIPMTTVTSSAALVLAEPVSCD